MFTLPGVCCYSVSAATGWPGVRILRQGKTENCIWNFCLSRKLYLELLSQPASKHNRDSTLCLCEGCSSSSSCPSDGNSGLLDEGGSASQVPQASIELAGCRSVVWPEWLVDGAGVTNCISFHARVGRFSPFCIQGLWPLLYLWSVAIALISFWLHLVSSYSCPRISRGPRVPCAPLFHVFLCSTCRERSSSQLAIGSPEFSSAIGSPE